MIQGKPKADSPDLLRYGEELSTLLAHYGAEKATETITSNVITELKAYHQLIVNKPENDIKLQLKTIFPNLSKLATICLSIPVATVSIERNSSQNLMKLIKARLRSSLNEKSFTHLMKIGIESPAELIDHYL